MYSRHLQDLWGFDIAEGSGRCGSGTGVLDEWLRLRADLIEVIQLKQQLSEVKGEAAAVAPVPSPVPRPRMLLLVRVLTAVRGQTRRARGRWSSTLGTAFGSRGAAERCHYRHSAPGPRHSL